MNDISKAIIRICTVINAHFGSIKAAYTFDAGPNAVIYTLEKDVPLVMTVMAKYFPAPGAADLYCNKPAGDFPSVTHKMYSHQSRHMSYISINTPHFLYDITDFVQAAKDDTYHTLVPTELQDKLKGAGRVPTAGDVKYIFSTKR